MGGAGPGGANQFGSFDPPSMSNGFGSNSKQPSLTRLQDGEIYRSGWNENGVRSRTTSKEQGNYGGGAAYYLGPGGVRTSSKGS